MNLIIQSNLKKYMIDSILHISSIIFILSNFYYLKNYERLDKPFLLREKHSKLDYIYFVGEILFIVWILLSFFSEYYKISLVFILLKFSRYPLQFINKNISRLVWKLTPPIIILIMSLVLIGLIQTLNFFRCCSVIIINSYPFLLHQLIIVSHLFLFL